MTYVDFWNKYIKSNEIERRKMLQELPITTDKNNFIENMTLTLFQSYIDDIIEVLYLKRCMKDE